MKENSPDLVRDSMVLVGTFADKIGRICHKFFSSNFSDDTLSNVYRIQMKYL